MFSFFRKMPQPDDQALADLATLFFFSPSEPTFGSGLLNPGRLNFSLESLEHVNDYLDMVRMRPEMPPHAQQVVVRCGAYVGDVIRKHADLDYHWYLYEKAAKFSTPVSHMGRSAGTSAILAAGSDHLIFPMAKVAAFLTNGRSEDVHLFVKTTLANARSTADAPKK
jgi:hypothetical protein